MAKKNKIFNKRRLPGPDTPQEQRCQEVEQMIGQWYQDKDVNKNTVFKPRSSWRVVFIILIIFLLTVILGLGSIYWLLTGRAVPPTGEVVADPLKMEIQWPTTVNSGEQVKIIITLSNTSAARLIDLDLNVLYPDNFVYLKSQPDAPYNSDQNSWRVQSLEAQASYKLEIEGQILGKSGEEKIVEAAVVYKPINFHSTFKGHAQAKFIINKSVLDISLEAPDNLLAEQDLTFKVKVKNASVLKLEGVSVRLDYPSDLQIKSSGPGLSEKVWNVGSLAPAEEKEMALSGRLVSKPSALKEFKAEVGLMQNGVFVLQNQVVHIAGVISPDVNITLEPAGGLSEFKFGEPFQLAVLVSNLSTLALEQGTLAIDVTDNADLLLWDTFKALGDYPFEVEKGDSVESNMHKIVFKNLPAMEPAGEWKIEFSLESIEVPYDIEDSDFKIIVKPSLSATSPDLAVPLKVTGNEREFTFK